MNKLFLFFLVACSALAFVQARPRRRCIACPKNEEYKCDGGVDGTCDNPNPCQKPPGPPGCYCKCGFVRDCDGCCIPVCDCPKKCKCKCNEEWRCGKADPTCDNPNPDTSCLKSKWGCWCKNGYVRNCKGECIPECECPRKCGCNEEWRKDKCDPTCEEPHKKCHGCPSKWACWCKEGYVRDCKGKCIPYCDCCDY